MKKLDIIEDAVGPSTWVSPVVTTEKTSGEIRLFIDGRQVNTAVIRERYPSPTVDDLVHELNGSKVFSTIDMREGFHQIELSPVCRDLTTRFKRLIYGLSSAPELFQKVIEQLISDISGVRSIADDIIIHGPSVESHDASLNALFARLMERGLTLRQEKGHFRQDHVSFYGLLCGRDKLSPDPSKVEAINNLSMPKDPDQIRSLLGMTNYCSRFIPKYSDITAPLRELTKKKGEWVWGEPQESAFNKLKEILNSKPTLAYFDPGRETEVLTDASPVGLSGILTQRDKDNKVHVVAYSSRALSPAEQRYLQTDREALAVVWACEHFHLYLYVKPFAVFADHKAIVPIYTNPKIKTTVRLERYALRLSPYQVTVKYRPGKENPADYLSRDPLPDPFPQVDPDHYVNFIAKHCVPSAMNIRGCTLEDATLQEVVRRVKNEDWHSPVPSGVDGNVLNKYKNVRGELRVSPDGDLIIRGTRLVFPAVLQSRCLALAHEGHLGLCKTKQLLREKVWFPFVDKNAEALVKNCLACQSTTISKNIQRG